MPDRIEHSIHIDAEPRVVFEALTTPDLVGRWLCHEAAVEPRVGGSFDMKWSTVDRGAPIRYEGSAEIVEFQPGKRLAFRVAPDDAPGPESIVDFRIDSSQRRHRRRRSPRPASPTTRPAASSATPTARGWLACLNVLRSLLEDEPGARLVPAPMHRDLPLPGQDPCGIAWDGSSLWLSDSGRGRIFRARSGDRPRPVARSSSRASPSGLAFDGE